MTMTNGTCSVCGYLEYCRKGAAKRKTLNTLSTWHETDMGWVCESCGEEQRYKKDLAFCPSCGAMMVDGCKEWKAEEVCLDDLKVV